MRNPDEIADYPSVARDLELLLNAARITPALRGAVLRVQAWHREAAEALRTTQFHIDSATEITRMADEFEAERDALIEWIGNFVGIDECLWNELPACARSALGDRRDA